MFAYCWQPKWNESMGSWFGITFSLFGQFGTIVSMCLTFGHIVSLCGRFGHNE